MTQFSRFSCCLFFFFFTFHLPQKNIVDLLPYEGSQPQELSINPMQDCLQEVPLPRVLAVKQLQELKKIKRQYNC